MRRLASSTGLALLGIAALSWLTSSLLPVLGLTSAALLFLMPVLFASVRGGLLPGLAAAVAGAAAYNFFLLPPRFTFHVQSPENVVSLIVFVIVAVVTSRLATLLRTREAEAEARAAASLQLAELSARLAEGAPMDALDTSLCVLAHRHGEIRLMTEGRLPEEDAAFSAVDLSAASWAMHNGDVTGHGTTIMPASEWSFLPLSPKRRDGNIMAIMRPADGHVRNAAELAHLGQIAHLLGQSWSRVALEHERRTRERLEDTDRLRRTFLASLAHDFRTPLTIITGQLEALSSTAPEAREALAAAKRLNHTMEDLIGAARLEEGSLSPRMESLDLVDVVSAAITAMPVLQGVSLERVIPADLPFIHGDAVLLQHVLQNLLGNAGRHACSAIRILAEHQHGHVALRISDDGPGIPAEERSRIFERFARAGGSDRQHGSGLGLAIVKGFSEAMGIGVSVDDAPGGGARFTLVLTTAPMGDEP